MDDKKKIILATEDILAKKLEDIYINVNLQQRFNSIKRDRYDNNFDLAEQFRKERNASRSFRIYGIIDSPIVDCDNLTIRVFSNSTGTIESQILTNQIATINSQSIGFGDKNIFGKRRGKYIIELNNYKISDIIYLEILGNGIDYTRTIVEQKLVFKDAGGIFVEYGTDTIDFGIGGGFEVIQNNFPFFYNKHWIKNNFQINKVIKRNIRFEKSFYSLDEGQQEVVRVELNEPSVFGTESVTVNLSTPISALDTATLGLDFSVDSPPFSFPMDLSWGIGQQFKYINITALTDFFIEKNTEQFTLTLNNPINATVDQGISNIESTTISIIDKTPKSYVNYNFQKIINNITPVTDPAIFSENLGQTPGYQMNLYGAKDGVGLPVDVNNNFRFFPNDTYEITITNDGDSTILPIIPGITTQEQVFLSGDSITIPVESKYINHNSLPNEVAIFDFKEKDTSDVGTFILNDSGDLSYVLNYYNDEFYINGIKFDSGPLVADDFVQKITQKYESVNMEIPFNITQQDKVVTLTSKHPAYNINGFIPKENGLENYALVDFSETPQYPNGRVSGITEQISFNLKLYANFNDATSCRYSFWIKKQGFKDIFISSTDIISSDVGVNAYLVTPIKNVFGPSLPAGDMNVCDSLTNMLDEDGYYLNGAALIASGLLNSQEATATNTHTSGYLPSFRLNPLTTELITCNNLIGISKFLS